MVNATPILTQSHNHRCYKAPFTAQLPSGRLASLLPPLPLLWPLLLPPPLPLLPPPSSLVVPLPPPLPMPAPRRYRLLPPSQQRGLSKLAHASARPQLPKISHIAVVAVAAFTVAINAPRRHRRCRCHGWRGLCHRFRHRRRCVRATAVDVVVAS